VVLGCGGERAVPDVALRCAVADLLGAQVETVRVRAAWFYAVLRSYALPDQSTCN